MAQDVDPGRVRLVRILVETVHAAVVEIGVRHRERVITGIPVVGIRFRDVDEPAVRSHPLSWGGRLIGVRIGQEEIVVGVVLLENHEDMLNRLIQLLLCGGRTDARLFAAESVSTPGSERQHQQAPEQSCLKTVKATRACHAFLRGRFA